MIYSATRRVIKTILFAAYKVQRDKRYDKNINTLSVLGPLKRRFSKILTKTTIYRTTLFSTFSQNLNMLETKLILLIADYEPVFGETH